MYYKREVLKTTYCIQVHYLSICTPAVQCSAGQTQVRQVRSDQTGKTNPLETPGLFNTINEQILFPQDKPNLNTSQLMDKQPCHHDDKCVIIIIWELLYFLFPTTDVCFTEPTDTNSPPESEPGSVLTSAAS